MNKQELLKEAWSSIRANAAVQEVHITQGLNPYNSNAKGRIEILLRGSTDEILTTGSEIMDALLPNYDNFGLGEEEALDLDIIPVDLASMMCKGLPLWEC